MEPTSVFCESEWAPIDVSRSSSTSACIEAFLAARSDGIEPFVALGPVRIKMWQALGGRGGGSASRKTEKTAEVRVCSNGGVLPI